MIVKQGGFEELRYNMRKGVLWSPQISVEFYELDERLWGVTSD